MRKNIFIKIVFTFTIFYCITTQLYSQNAYRVTYKHFWPGGRNDFETILVFNDSAAFHFITTMNFQDPFKSDSVYGTELIHHGLFYDNVSHSIYDQVNNAKGEKMMIKRNFDPTRWTFTDDKPKKIMGYLCKAASYDHDKLKLKAWYTDELPFSYGPYYSFGLPGLVLQVKIAANNTRIKVSKIEKGNFRIILPANVDVFTEEEYRLKKNN